MPESNFPKDDNLRLVLSKGHQEWLDGQTAEARKMTLGHIFMIVVCSLWFAGVVYYGGLFEREEPCVIIPDGSTLVQMQIDGLVSEEAISCLVGNSYSGPAIEQSDWVSTGLLIGSGLLSLLAILMILASVVDILRNLYKLYEFRGFSKDHDAFLKRYNRR